MFYFDQNQIEDQNPYTAGDRFVVRQMAAQYNLGIQERGPAGQQMAGESLAKLLGWMLTKIFR